MSELLPKLKSRETAPPKSQIDAKRKELKDKADQEKKDKQKDMNKRGIKKAAKAKAK